MDEVLEILKKKREELRRELEGEMPEFNTNEWGRNETREQWLNWLEHLIFLMQR